MKPFDDVEAIDEVIAILDSPLSREEKQAGWSLEAKAGVLSGFVTVKEEVSNLRKTPALSGLSRSLDAWGISDGGLYSKCMTINSKLIKARFML